MELFSIRIQRTFQLVSTHIPLLSLQKTEYLNGNYLKMNINCELALLLIIYLITYSIEDVT